MEGPSLVILTEELSSFINKKITRVDGNSKQDINRLKGKKITDIQSWGKHLLIQLEDFYLRIHFLLFGSYRINEQKEHQTPRLSLIFKKQEINFYSCSVKFFEGKIEDSYNWTTDIMSSYWNEKEVLKKIKTEKDMMVSDLLMNQNIFTGVGNIIKNEVLFNLHMHPETYVKDLSLKQLKSVIKEARNYSHRFYEWKKDYVLKKNWLIYKKRTCPRCGIPIIIKKTGKGVRMSYYCANCQRKEDLD
jgi:endonuclease-8